MTELLGDFFCDRRALFLEGGAEVDQKGISLPKKGYKNAYHLKIRILRLL